MTHKCINVNLKNEKTQSKFIIIIDSYAVNVQLRHYPSSYLDKYHH